MPNSRIKRFYHQPLPVQWILNWRKKSHGHRFILIHLGCCVGGYHMPYRSTLTHIVASRWAVPEAVWQELNKLRDDKLIAEKARKAAEASHAQPMQAADMHHFVCVALSFCLWCLYETKFEPKMKWEAELQSDKREFKKAQKDGVLIAHGRTVEICWVGSCSKESKAKQCFRTSSSVQARSRRSFEHSTACTVSRWESCLHHSRRRNRHS